MTFLALSSSFEAFDVIECVHAVIVLYYELIVYYPFTPKISLVTLLTVCHTILFMTFQRVLQWSTNNPLTDTFFILITCLIYFVLKIWGEILSWLLMEVIKFKKKCLKGIMVRFVAWKRISINFQINFEQELFTH